MTDADVEAQIFALLAQRKPHTTICPSEVARALERVDDLFGAALECNRDEFEGLVRRLHRGASKGQRAEIVRFHSNP